MGRRLSDLQSGILGIACTVNAHTQGGEPRVKRPGIGGPVDYVTPLGMCLLYGIPIALQVPRSDPRGGAAWQTNGGYFANTPRANSARAAASRAASHLVARGLMAFSVQPWGSNFLSGYVLTERGLEVGRGDMRAVPLIDLTLLFFGITGKGLPRSGDYGMPRREFHERFNDAVAPISASRSA
jgi:hypothetical protein